MGLRFYRRLKVLPGVTLNLSRRGISTSLGVKGAHVTLGHGRIRETVGIPGSGISYTESQRLAHGEAAGSEQAPEDAPHRSLLGRIVRVLVLGIIDAWLVSFAIITAIAFWPK